MSRGAWAAFVADCNVRTSQPTAVTSSSSSPSLQFNRSSTLDASSSLAALVIETLQPSGQAFRTGGGLDPLLELVERLHKRLDCVVRGRSFGARGRRLRPSRRRDRRGRPSSSTSVAMAASVGSGRFSLTVWVSLRHEATASGRVTRRASSDPACIAPPKGIGSPSGKALSGRRGSLCTSGRTCPMCGGTASPTS